MSGVPGVRLRVILGVLAVVAGLPEDTHAGGLRRRVREQRAVPTTQVVASRPENNTRRESTLGTFYSTPYMFVRGNGPAGGGYSPLDSFGDTTMVLYGPLSALRATSAPVMTYSRGYDGRTILSPGTSFSTPNLPGLTPVVYPTQATNYFAPRHTSAPPWWQSGINFIDQN